MHGVSRNVIDSDVKVPDATRRGGVAGLTYIRAQPLYVRCVQRAALRGKEHVCARRDQL